MPHVVIEGDVDLEGLAARFRPILIRSAGDVLRADRCYLEREGRALLLEALVVESGRKLPFYVKVTRHDRGSVTVRVDPMTHPERSVGVRTLVAHVADWLLASTPRSRRTRANVVLPSELPGSELPGSESSESALPESALPENELGKDGNEEGGPS